MWQTILIVIIVFLFIWTIYQSIQSSSAYSKGLKKLLEDSAKRPQLTKSEYVKLLMNKNYSKEHIEAIYDTTAVHLVNKSFSFYPQDDIHILCKLQDLDDVEFIIQVFKRIELEWSNDDDIVEINDKFNCFNAEYLLALIDQQVKTNIVHNRVDGSARIN